MTFHIELADDRLELAVEVGADEVPRLVRLAPAGTGERDPGLGGALSLVDAVLAGEGRAWSGRRYCESATAPRLRYAGHEHTDGDDHGRPWRQLRVGLADPVTGLRARVHYRIPDGTGTVRSWTQLVNEGAAALTVTSVTSFLGGGAVGDQDRPPEADQRHRAIDRRRTRGRPSLRLESARRRGRVRLQRPRRQGDRRARAALRHLPGREVGVTGAK